MSTSNTPTPSRGRPGRLPWRGFTIVEVMMAVMVMAFGITTSITVLQQGFKSLDTARNIVVAGQMMQTEIEKLRALPWATVSTFPVDVATAVPLDAAYATLPNSGNFSLTRTITAEQAGMLRIDFTVRWKSFDGRPISRTFSTYYAQYGLYDWFITS